jgi:hypothetical protein
VPRAIRHHHWHFLNPLNACVTRGRPQIRRLRGLRSEVETGDVTSAIEGDRDIISRALPKAHVMTTTL